MRKAKIGVIASAALLTAAAGGFQVHNSYASAVAKGSKTVKATEAAGTYLFSPKTLTITKGTKVVWTNKSSAPHTVTGTGTFSSMKKSLATGKTVSRVFNKAGTYHYYCTIHPYMKATIIVK